MNAGLGDYPNADEAEGLFPQTRIPIIPISYRIYRGTAMSIMLKASGVGVKMAEMTAIIRTA
jgi:hypothetical protein